MNSQKLRIVILTIDEPYFITRTVYPLLNRTEFDIVGIGVMKSIVGAQQNPLRFALELFNSFGLKGCIQHIAFYLKCYIHNFFSFISKKVPFNLKILAKRNNIEFFKIKDVNSNKLLSKIQNLSPDIILSIAATQIFKKNLIESAKIATINIHSALLPKYRGTSPNFWNLLNDEQISGVSVHFISEKLDAGNLISQKKMVVNKNDTLFSLNSKTAMIAPQLIIESIPKIIKPSFIGRKMNINEGSFFSLPRKKDVDKFIEKGKKFY